MIWFFGLLAIAAIGALVLMSTIDKSKTKESSEIEDNTKQGNKTTNNSLPSVIQLHLKKILKIFLVSSFVCILYSIIIINSEIFGRVYRYTYFNYDGIPYALFYVWLLFAFLVAIIVPAIFTLAFLSKANSFYFKIAIELSLFSSLIMGVTMNSLYAPTLGTIFLFLLVFYGTFWCSYWVFYQKLPDFLFIE